MSDVIQACFKCGIKLDQREMINEGSAKGFLCKSCYTGHPKPKKEALTVSKADVIATSNSNTIVLEGNVKVVAPKSKSKKKK